MGFCAMNATASSREKREFQRPARANKNIYLASDLARTLAGDAAFFADTGRYYRIRPATAAEIRQVQTFEHRLIKPCDACEILALIHLNDKGHRRRVIIEASESISRPSATTRSSCCSTPWSNAAGPRSSKGTCHEPATSH